MELLKARGMLKALIKFHNLDLLCTPCLQNSQVRNTLLLMKQVSSEIPSSTMCYPPQEGGQSLEHWEGGQGVSCPLYPRSQHMVIRASRAAHPGPSEHRDQVRSFRLAGPVMLSFIWGLATLFSEGRRC